MNIRKTIKSRAEDRGFSQLELGERSGVAQGTISAYFRGDRDLTGANIDRLCVALGLELKPKQGRGPGRKQA